jgi:GT2 family glycosyltransferase
MSTEPASPTPEVSVCVAVYRRHRPPNISTLAADISAALAGRSYELVVTLNGITAERAGLPDHAHAVPFAVNRGVPVAWNAAVRASTGRLVCIINDDVRLPAGALDTLARALDSHPDAGVVGPVGTRWDLAAARHLEYVDTSAQVPGTLTPCEVLSGFLLLTTRRTFDTVGGFDEAFTPCGFEEVDYCTAVRRSLGLQAYVVAGVPVEHEFVISAKRRWQRIRYDGKVERLGDIADRNRAYFQRKWAVGGQ